MRGALLKKRYGIPVALLLLLLAGTAVTVASVAALGVASAIRYPTHEGPTIDLGTSRQGRLLQAQRQDFWGFWGQLTT